MSALHPANDKIREAEFFLFMMRQHPEKYEFKYFLSAFLSAASSCTEHNRLFSSDQRFKDWYRNITATVVVPSILPKLVRLRNKEIHHRGTETHQRVGFARPDDDPIISNQIEITMDFSSGKPVGSIGTAEMAEPGPVELTSDWVWDDAGSPKVFDLCGEGLRVPQHIIKLRDAMGFPD